ncbi:hypothetical protein QZH41_006481 [Actinostola sp. cb2023]|nr:hypothetical protein QZH41_006481 [Actinostola sp. cb2023]
MQTDSLSDRFPRAVFQFLYPSKLYHEIAMAITSIQILFHSHYQMWSTSWLFVLEAIFIFAGNAITIVIFVGTPRLRKRKHALIVSLAVADLFVGLISVPMYVYWVENSDTSKEFKDVYALLDIVFGTASLFGLDALALERTHATYFPFKHGTALTKVPYIVGIAVVWASAFIFALSVFFIHGMATFVVFVALAISLLIFLTSYFLIWAKVTCVTEAQHHAIHQENKKLTVTLAIVTTWTVAA